MSGLFEQQYSFAQDVDEEIAPEPQLLVHILQAVVNDADGRPQPLAFGELGKQPVLSLGPELRPVGQIFMADDNQQVEVGIIATYRIIDPVAAGIASEQDDLEDLAVAEALHGAARDRFSKTLANQLDDVLKLAL